MTKCSRCLCLCLCVCVCVCPLSYPPELEESTNASAQKFQLDETPPLVQTEIHLANACCRRSGFHVENAGKGLVLGTPGCSYLVFGPTVSLVSAEKSHFCFNLKVWDASYKQNTNSKGAFIAMESVWMGMRKKGPFCKTVAPTARCWPLCLK